MQNADLQVSHPSVRQDPPDIAGRPDSTEDSSLCFGDWPCTVAVKPDASGKSVTDGSGILESPKQCAQFLVPPKRKVHLLRFRSCQEGNLALRFAEECKSRRFAAILRNGMRDRDWHVMPGNRVCASPSAVNF
jgi:hypothetical protein